MVKTIFFYKVNLGILFLKYFTFSLNLSTKTVFFAGNWEVNTFLYY